MTGAGDKPVAGASVTLTDSKGNTLSRVINSSSAGHGGVHGCADRRRQAGSDPDGWEERTTKDVDIDLPKGEKLQAITLLLPEVTAVVEPPAGAPASTPAEAKTGESKAASDSKGSNDGKSGNPDTGTFPAAPAPSGGGGLRTCLG